MAVAIQYDAETPVLARAAGLLGGRRVLGRTVEDTLAAHRVVADGLSRGAVLNLRRESPMLRDEAVLERALGLSARTVHRYQAAPRPSLSPEQGGRVWRYAETLARAEGVFGGRAQAEDWLLRPATGLGGEAPVDLLSSPAGARLVEEFLGRLEYGVYT